MDLLKSRTAPFDAWYAVEVTLPTRPYMDEILMDPCLFDLKRLERGAMGVIGAGMKNTDGARSDGGVRSAGAVF